jgi:hypothetical protein
MCVLQMCCPVPMLCLWWIFCTTPWPCTNASWAANSSVLRARGEQVRHTQTHWWAGETDTHTQTHCSLECHKTPNIMHKTLTPSACFTPILQRPSSVTSYKAKWMIKNDDLWRTPKVPIESCLEFSRTEWGKPEGTTGRTSEFLWTCREWSMATNVGFEALTEVSVKRKVFWVVTPSPCRSPPNVRSEFHYNVALPTWYKN